MIHTLSLLDVHPFFIVFNFFSLGIEIRRRADLLFWCHLMADPVQHAKLVGPSPPVPSETSSTEKHLQLCDLRTQQH